MNSLKTKHFWIFLATHLTLTIILGVGLMKSVFSPRLKSLAVETLAEAGLADGNLENGEVFISDIAFLNICLSGRVNSPQARSKAAAEVDKLAGVTVLPIDNHITVSPQISMAEVIGDQFFVKGWVRDTATKAAVLELARNLVGMEIESNGLVADPAVEVSGDTEEIKSMNRSGIATHEDKFAWLKPVFAASSVVEASKPQPAVAGEWKGQSLVLTGKVADVATRQGVLDYVKEECPALHEILAEGLLVDALVARCEPPAHGQLVAQEIITSLAPVLNSAPPATAKAGLPWMSDKQSVAKMATALHSPLRKGNARPNHSRETNQIQAAAEKKSSQPDAS